MTQHALDLRLEMPDGRLTPLRKQFGQVEVPDELLENGEVFTRRWVVDLILDLAGYTSDKDLAKLHAIEPACGSGAFLGPMIERLCESSAVHNRSIMDAPKAIQAMDLLNRNVAASRQLVADVLVRFGHDALVAEQFAANIVTQDDFLLRPRETDFADFVLGNPPYIRLEDLPPGRKDAYRAACPTMGGRADVYVGFMEVALESLRSDGVVGFIVADRWMHNAYGNGLRRLVTSRFSVDVTISMHDVDAFEKQVSAYPAVTVISSKPQGQSVIAGTTQLFGADDARELVKWTETVDRRAVKNERYEIDTLPHWFGGDGLWPSGSLATIHFIEDLNDRFQPLEDPRTNTRVSIGVATGADKVYVTMDPHAAEPERMLPLAMADDTNSGVLQWSGHYLVNPWEENQIVELDDWPTMASYFEQHSKSLRNRDIARKNERRWYRTIDRVTASLTDRPKLLFPDMRMTSRPVYDPGGLYPHHNLYYVVSDTWDLQVLGGLLFSRVAEATIEAYCVKMRGGTLRFQAQYLRQVRVPDPASIAPSVAAALAAAFEKRDSVAATRAALDAYGLRADQVM